MNNDNYIPLDSEEFSKMEKLLWDLNQEIVLHTRMTAEEFWDKYALHSGLPTLSYQGLLFIKVRNTNK